MRFKKRIKYNKKQTFTVAFFMVLVVALTLGFAAIRTTLTVSGTGAVAASKWDVYFTNIQAESGSVTATTAPAITDKTQINFSASLAEVGEFYGFTVDVVNDGTYDAKIDSIEILPELTNEQKEYFDYTVTYSDGVEIQVGDALDAGATETLLVHFEYKENEDTSKYPTDDVDFDFSVNLYYSQGKGNAVNHVAQPVSFADDDWDTIVAAIRSGNTANYNVGDTKTVDMGSLGTHTLRIANTSIPSECSTTGFSQTACGFVVEFADVIPAHRVNPNTSGDTIGTGNHGGWEYSDMRAYLNNGIYAYENINYSSSGLYTALPADLRNKIIDTTVVSGHGRSQDTNFTTTDKIYLLSTKEVWGKDAVSNTIDYDSAEAETRQLDYYHNRGVTTANYTGAVKNNLSGTSNFWYLRTSVSLVTSTFYTVKTDGNWNTNESPSITTGGVSPAFRIG